MKKKSRRGGEMVDFIAGATLEQLQGRFPREWSRVGEALVAAAGTRRPEALVAFVNEFTSRAGGQQTRGEPRNLAEGASVKTRGNAGVGSGSGGRGRRVGHSAQEAGRAAFTSRLAMARMAKLAAGRALQATAAQIATGKADQTLRFGRFSGGLVQRLLFGRDLERKPASMTAFRWLWPLIPQRRLLMPLVQARGIYCFYSRELIKALAKMIGGRSCTEIAAGDGTLARFLNAVGTPVVATDDRSWGHAVSYPDDVACLDASAALQRTQPRAVVCSFPPPGNQFEREVFRTPSVDLYVVITTKHRFAAGDWDAYDQQTAFRRDEPADLGGLVLPPEIDPTVLVFRRRLMD